MGKRGIIKTIAAWILGIILILIVLALLLFGFYGLGELTPSLVITLPILLAGRDLKEHYAGRGDKPFHVIVARFFMMPFILLAWLSPLVAFNVLWKTFFFELEGTSTISIFGIPIPGLEPGPVFDHLAAICGLALSVWMVVDCSVLMLRRIRMMDEMTTTPIPQARTGRGEFRGIARVIEDEAERKTKTSGAGVSAATLEFGIQPILMSRVTEGNVATLLSRFHLEEGDRKILVDPLGASFFDASGALPGARENPHFIMLSQRVKEEEIAPGKKRMTAALLPGDRVYLFGNAERHSTHGLVVRPVFVKETSGLLNRFLFNLDREIASLDPRNMFILADGSEEQVKSILRLKIRSVALFSLIWGVPATMLLIVLLSG